MASEVLRHNNNHHHQHTVRLPAAATVSGSVQFNGGQPVIINLGMADVEMPDQTAPNGNAPAAAPTPVPVMLPSVRSLLMSCESSLPFVFIILAKLLYDHRLGTYSSDTIKLLIELRNPWLLLNHCQLAIPR